MFDLLIQNNATKEEWSVTGLENASITPLFFQFEDFEMPEGASYGEYTYALVYNGRSDVEWVLKDVLLDSVARISSTDYALKDLRPVVGLMKYLDSTNTKESTPTYRDKDVDFTYYRRK